MPPPILLSGAILSESRTDVVALLPENPEFTFSNLYKFIELILRSAPANPDSDRGVTDVFTPPAIIGSPKASLSLAYFRPNIGILVDYCAMLILVVVPPETATKSYAEA